MIKLILVEDEELTRAGIVNLIRNSGLGIQVVGEAEDGEKALSLIRERKPDIVLTDINMPKLNGLGLIEQVKEEQPDICFVILSGYDDFEYARKALHYGVQDYLLKPVLPEQIIDVLNKSLERMDSRHKFLSNIEELKKQVIESLPILRDRFLHELAGGHLTTAQILTRAEYLELDLAGDFYGVAILKIKNFPEVNDPAVRKEDLLQQFLFDILDEIFPDNINIHSFAYSDDEIVLLFCIRSGDRGQAFIQIGQAAAKLNASLHKYFHIHAFTAIGKLYDNILQMKQSFEEAREAMIYSFSMQGGSVINFEDIALKKSGSMERPTKMEEKIVIHAKLQEMDSCFAKVRELFRFYTEGDIRDPQHIKIHIFELISGLYRNQDAQGVEVEALLDTDQFTIYNQIWKTNNLEDLETWVLQFFEKYILGLQKAHAGRSKTVVSKVKEMVELYLGDSDFALDDAAARVFISPNYLRQIFKGETGESFVEYLTRRRMEKALELLGDPTLKIQQIAELLGYENQRYFALVFKKYYGKTPTEHRESKDFLIF